MSVSFSLTKRPLAQQVLALTLSVSMIVAVLVATFVIWQGRQAAEASVHQQLRSALQSVESSLISTFEINRVRVERQFLMFQRMLGELPTPFDYTVETGSAGALPAIQAGETVLNGNTAFLQRIRTYANVDVEVYYHRNNQWLRVATLQRTEDGQPLTGEPLDNNSYPVQLLSAEQSGTSVIQRDGRWYAIHVRPLKDDYGKQFGGVSLTVDLTDDISSTLSYIRQTTVAEHASMEALFVNGKGQAEFLVHPVYQGEELSVATEREQALYQRMLTQEMGQLEYNTEEGEALIASFLSVPQWNWTLIASGKKADFMAVQNRQILLVVIMLLIGGCVTGGMSYLSMRRALRPVQDITEGIARLGNGDLTQDVPTGPANSRNEVHLMAQSINGTRKRIAVLAQQMGRTGSHVAASSQQTLQALNQIGQGTEVQSDAARQVASAVEELSVSIAQIADNSREADQFSKESSSAAEEGSAVVAQTVQEIQQMAKQVAASAESVQTLEASSRQISEVVKTIQDIAEQTNLLALNAAIEAARAGENGRGFSVVADEVRNLAERTKNSTAEIAQVIASIQAQTSEAASVMRTMDQDMQRSAEGASQTSDVLRRILDAAHRTAEVISDISNAAREQRAASEQIASRVEQIAQHAGDAASSVQQSVGNAEALQDRAKELEDAIKTLRT